MPQPDRDNPLAASKRRLHNAVTALIEPVPIWDSGTVRLSDATYTRLRAALRDDHRHGVRRVPSSRLPCRTDVLAHIIEIDMTAAEWQPGTSTHARLTELAAQDRRPQDCELLDTYSATIEGWTLKAIELIGDKPPEVSLRLPCPSCGRRFVHHRSGGEKVRGWALRISEDGARCQGCHATWPPEQFEFLAKLLGCPALPA